MDRTISVSEQETPLTNRFVPCFSANPDFLLKISVLSSPTHLCLNQQAYRYTGVRCAFHRRNDRVGRSAYMIHILRYQNHEIPVPFFPCARFPVLPSMTRALSHNNIPISRFRDKSMPARREKCSSFLTVCSTLKQDQGSKTNQATFRG